MSVSCLLLRTRFHDNNNMHWVVFGSQKRSPNDVLLSSEPPAVLTSTPPPDSESVENRTYSIGYGWTLRILETAEMHQPGLLNVGGHSRCPWGTWILFLEGGHETSVVDACKAVCLAKQFSYNWPGNREYAAGFMAYRVHEMEDLWPDGFPMVSGVPGMQFAGVRVKMKREAEHETEGTALAAGARARSRSKKRL